MMKLYWSPQTRASRAVWALEEAGVPYERVEIDIRSNANDDPAFRAISPFGKVPALVDGEAVMCDSAAICAYVGDKVADKKLAPAIDDPRRGRYLQWILFTGTYLEPAVMWARSGADENKSMHGWGDLDTMYKVLEDGVKDSPWLLGDQFTMADVLVGSTVSFGRKMGFMRQTDVLNAYADRCEARPAYQKAMALDAAGADNAAPSAKA